jgi:RNA polymerase sigma-70 factor (ECF subfamily)
MSEAQPLLDHLFRRQSGRMVAHLTRVLGPANLSLAEESVQESMLKALQIWPINGVPQNPEAWLFRTAHNAAIDAIRRARTFENKTDTILTELTRSAAKPDLAHIEEELRDDELRMIFLCCHPAIPRDSSIALSLRTVGGFSVREIARAFLADDTAIAQRLVRAKKQIRETGLKLEQPDPSEMETRLDAVLDVIYFIFNEGYTAHEGDDLIRLDLCQEGLRLASLIATSSLSRPRVHALVALMALQSARSAARVDARGDLILLEEQDRTQWDQSLIRLGFKHFEKSMSGFDVSQYHVEAAIAATHARAAASGVIDWKAILELYDQLYEINPSPIVALNRAVAVDKVHGPYEALKAIKPLEADPKLNHYYLLLALRGHLLLELGRREEAAAFFSAALELRCSEPERRFLMRKLSSAKAPKSIPEQL